MKELAKECLEAHKKTKKFSSMRKEKGDKLAADIK